MKYLKQLLEDRDNTFEIDLELKIRKLLEHNVDYTFEIQKNNDKYDYDLKAFKYYIKGADYRKEPIAFIEVEISENWKDNYPSYWEDYSFLMRKVYKWDNKKQTFTKELKENASKTIYLIVNKNINDAICQKIPFIAKLEPVEREIGIDLRRRMCLRTSKDNPSIIRGFNNCMEFIYEFIKRRSKSQGNPKTPDPR